MRVRYRDMDIGRNRGLDAPAHQHAARGALTLGYRAISPVGRLATTDNVYRDYPRRVSKNENSASVLITP